MTKYKNLKNYSAQKDNSSLIREIVFKLKNEGRSNEEIIEDINDMEDLFSWNEKDKEQINIELERYALIQDHSRKKEYPPIKNDLKSKLEKKIQEEMEFLLRDPEIIEISKPRDILVPIYSAFVPPSLNSVNAFFLGHEKCKECEKNLNGLIVSLKLIHRVGERTFIKKNEYPLCFYCKNCGSIYEPDSPYKKERKIKDKNTFKEL
ncbi:hypothetical protein GYA25_03455 [Candidatus Woesearchaeota archaeon]|nr:hypothetical protein [Candidatus Woesearchaeota archaeon]